MDRLAKGLRLSCGLVLLINLAAFFLPLIRITQENYADINYSQLDYVLKLVRDELGTSGILITIGCMILPFLLSLLAGIYGIVGSPRQIFSSITSIVICLLYGTQMILVSRMVPELTNGQIYHRGMVGMIQTAISAVAMILGILGIIFVPRIRKSSSSEIPQVKEIKEEQERARYNIIEPMSGSGDQNISMSNQVQGQAAKPTPEPIPVPTPAPAPYNPANPRGILVGIAGIYAGAEIPFMDGEAIRLGRLPDNDLVFENQSRVSRNHCVLQWYGDKKKYRIKDVSSNGSYINGSEECLPQNMEIWLEPGTVIDFGSPDNRFRLE